MDFSQIAICFSGLHRRGKIKLLRILQPFTARVPVSIGTGIVSFGTILATIFQGIYELIHNVCISSINIDYYSSFLSKLMLSERIAALILTYLINCWKHHTCRQYHRRQQGIIHSGRKEYYSRLIPVVFKDVLFEIDLVWKNKM